MLLAAHRTAPPARPPLPLAPLRRDWEVRHQPAPIAGLPECWLALPRDPDPAARPLVAVHGIHRDAQGQARRLAAAASAAGRIVIAPLFDRRRYPNYQQPILRQRADIALLELIAQLQGRGLIHGRRFDLAGYSGGAQFAHRFAMLHPHRVGRLTLTAAGWYTLPHGQAPYPYGLGRPERRQPAWTPLIAQGIDDFLRLPIAVCVGEQDNLADAHTRRDPTLDALQGNDRLSRAHHWTRAVQDAAQARGITPRIQLHTLPRCGHDFGACVEQGGLSDILFAA